MDPRRAPEYTIDLITDRSSVQEIATALFHTIFFHRYFPPTAPQTHEIASLTLPFLPVPEITNLLAAKITPAPTTYILQFLERKRKKSTWFSTGKAEEQQVWESWVVNVRVGGGGGGGGRGGREGGNLGECVMRVLEVVGRERDHVPPITTSEVNPFPFRILVRAGSGGNGEGREGWGKGYF